MEEDVVIVKLQTLLEKLQFKDEKNLLVQGLPSTVEKQFAKLTFNKSVTPLLKMKKIDFALVFAVSHKQLKDILHDVLPALHEDAKFWIAYPKVSSKIVSDLARTSTCQWECITTSGYEGVRTITMDNVWTAMRFKKADKIKNATRVSITGVPVEIAGVDHIARTISAPPDLIKLFSKNKKAETFFDALSFTNKKEYVGWITSAKKEETKIARLEATIEKLNSGKKNPSEK
jgi:hypothetical protein